MFNPESLSEQLFFTTTRIEITHNDDSRGAGTGFLFHIEKEGKKYIFLITNKHVIKNSKKGVLMFNINEDGKPLLGQTYGINIDNFENVWINHPSNEIDIAIMPFAPVVNELEEIKKVKLYYKSIPDNLIPTEELIIDQIDAIEEILFIGYPNNIFDRKNLIPVGRRGITATPFAIDFEEKPVFLIDASVFPGSSGSPVFICNVGSYSPKGKGLVVGHRFHFLGVLSSVFTLDEYSVVEPHEIPTRIIPIVRQRQMIDLGIVFKSRIIKELIISTLRTG
ncbi:MAG: serine protease, partial [Candidatus Hodarchaeota archaeon]